MMHLNQQPTTEKSYVTIKVRAPRKRPKAGETPTRETKLLHGGLVVGEVLAVNRSTLCPNVLRCRWCEELAAKATRDQIEGIDPTYV